MDTAQWPQEIVVKPIEEIVTNTCPKAAASSERKIRPQKEHVMNCPRCNSTNTKFCYYNNYSLTQPRYFCKTCRRYWTEGGSLRNIPVGGGSRKNKRSSSSQSPSISTTPLLSSSKKLPGLVTQNPNSKIHDGQDLNLAFPRGTTISELVHIPIENNNNKNNNNQIPSSCSSSPSVSQLSALELLTGISSRGFNSFIPMPVQDPNNVYTSGFPMQDQFKPTLNFSLDGLGTGNYGGLHGVQDQTSTGRLLFPFEDLKHVSNDTTEIEPNKEQADSAGYWTGMLGGGSW